MLSQRSGSLKLLILADECTNYKIIKTLRDNGFEVISVSEKHPSISDKTVLERSIEYKAIVLTEDSDFGEWVFAHKAETNGVIFLRYSTQHFADITDSLIKVLNTAGDLLYGKFVVITVKKVRVRDI